MYTYQESSEIIGFLHEHASGLVNHEILNEDVQLSATSYVVDKMLDLTLSRYSKVDFSDIERSRGDVQACKFYKNLRESIDILCDIDMNTHKIPAASVVSTALNNLDLLKKNFMYGFRTKNSLAIILYNTIYYSIMECTSYLIAASIDYVKTGNKMIVNPYEVNGRDVLLVNNLIKFNEEVAKGTVVKFINSAHDTEVELQNNGELNEAAGFYETAVKLISSALKKIYNVKTDENGKPIMKDGKVVKGLTTIGKVGLTAVAITGFIYLATHIVPIIKSCMYLIFSLKHKISEAARVQAELIEVNIELAKENNADEETIKKQEKAAERFRKIAEKFALETDKANRDSKKEEHEEKITPDAVLI